MGRKRCNYLTVFGNFTKTMKYKSLSRYILLANYQSINPKYFSLQRPNYLIYSFHRSCFFKETSELVPVMEEMSLYSRKTHMVLELRSSKN